MQGERIVSLKSRANACDNNKELIALNKRQVPGKAEVKQQQNDRRDSTRRE
jgi:hypothetical protein